MIYARSPDCWQNGVQHVSLCVGRIRSAEGADHSVNRRCLFSKFDVVKKRRLKKAVRLVSKLSDVKPNNVRTIE